VRALVTGAAGFIGSHLCAHLLDEGDEVLALDCFTPYYDRLRKEANLATISASPGFRFVEANIVEADLPALLRGIDVVFHLSAQPGVRSSWGSEFAGYVRDNVLATQLLLEAATAGAVRRFVAASSSSIYGDAEALPTHESALPSPVSPYGVTKLAAEHLCGAYRATGALDTASLRLFTVYGPGQRPDMAFARLVSAAVRGEPFEVYGDGEQSRDFTFVDDVARAFRACATSGWCGVANVGGGSRMSLNDAIRIVESLTGPVRVVRKERQRGDVRNTGADITIAREAFGWSPAVSLHDGLRAMVEAERLRS
jgi:nucleoside-diphosphate-sugar epimerase